MKHIKISLLIISILLFQSFTGALAQSDSLPKFQRIDFKKLSTEKDYKEGEVIVKYKKDKINLEKNSGQNKAKNFENTKNLRKIDSVKELNIDIFKSDRKTTDLIDEIKKDPNVEYAEPNLIRRTLSTPNDSYFNYQWALQNTNQAVPNSSGIGSTTGLTDADIDAPEAWNLENSGNAQIIVAVIDTGAKYSHEDLSTNMWDGSACKDENNLTISGGCPNHGWDYKDNDNNPDDSQFCYYGTDTNGNCITFGGEGDVSGHGTFISGIIGSTPNNSKGISGISLQNKVKIMPIRFDLDLATELKAISFAKNNGAKVINASFGGSASSQAEKDAIDAFPGIFVAAAGNDATDNDNDTHLYPSDYTSSNIISVAATDQNDNLAYFSNYGSTSVDLGAPGVNILSTYNTTVADYAIGDGTSFAAPYVSGAAAMLLSKDPALSISNTKNRLINSGNCILSFNNKISSGRRLNLKNLLEGTSTICPSPMHRFWSDQKQGHFYTISEDEKNYIVSHYPTNIWKYEGIAYYAYTSQQPDNTAIYRFWSDQKQHHFYTASEDEKNYVIAHYPTNIWKYEGIAYYAYTTEQPNTTAVHRFWSDQKQGHFYTSSEDEKNYIIAHYPTNVWKYEGVAWYVPN